MGGELIAFGGHFYGCCEKWSESLQDGKGLNQTVKFTWESFFIVKKGGRFVKIDSF